ncbi:NEL-type E3 ubiquitin ligase domain-containing protein [Pandoraea pnomenusa]|uniref:leucine-rich repeat domain-containing protein n=1 Tax=Pandoraea pnomenusa TaxID=93220 RepID=UPI003CFB17CA
MAALEQWANAVTGLPGEKRKEAAGIIATCAKTEALKLDLSQLGLTELPPDIGRYCPQIRELLLAGNRLDRLPESMRHCRSLTHVDISMNRLYLVPDAISTWPNLTFLNLEGNRLITLSDELFAHPRLAELKVNHTRLRTLPESIRPGSPLRRIDLRGMDIRRLGGAISNLSSECDVLLSSSLYAPGDIEALMAMNAPRFDFYADGSLNISAPGSDVCEEVCRWYPGRDIRVWSEISTDSHAPMLASFLDVLHHIAEFRHPDSRNRLEARVERVLRSFERASDTLRATLYDIIDQGLNSCEDTVAVALQQVEMALVEQDAISGNISVSELMRLAKQNFREEALTKFLVSRELADRGVDDASASHGFADQVSVYLVYRRALQAKGIEFAGGTEMVIYSRLAGDIDGALGDSIDLAYATLMSLEGGSEMQSHVSQYAPLQGYVRSQNRAAFAEVEAEYAKRAEILNAANDMLTSGESVRRWNALSDERNKALSELHHRLLDELLRSPDSLPTSRGGPIPSPISA